MQSSIKIVILILLFMEEDEICIKCCGGNWKLATWERQNSNEMAQLRTFIWNLIRNFYGRRKVAVGMEARRVVFLLIEMEESSGMLWSKARTGNFYLSSFNFFLFLLSLLCRPRFSLSSYSVHSLGWMTRKKAQCIEAAAAAAKNKLNVRVHKSRRILCVLSL